MSILQNYSCVASIIVCTSINHIRKDDFYFHAINNITCTIVVAAKPVYSTNTTYNATPRVIAQPKVQAPVQASSAATYVYPTVVTTQQPASSYTTTYAGGSNATTTVSYTSKGKNSGVNCN